jgi:hypothetical protein
VRIRLAFLVIIALALGASTSGCGCINSAVNSSDSARWWLFSNFGAQKICPEMKKRGVPLKMSALGPQTVGRFFPQECQVSVDEAHHTIAVQASGTGYVMLPLTRRVGFFCGIQVEYRPDFRLTDDGLYVWGQFNRVLAPPDLRILGVENPLVNLATRTPVGDVATLLGQGVVESEVGRGFTVVRQDDGDDFTLGHLEPPAKPPRAFKTGKNRTMLATDSVQIAPASREYLGPLDVNENSSALYFHSRLAGQGLVFAVVERATGDYWRGSYQAGQPLGPAPGPTVTFGNIMPGEGEQKIAVPKGQYYLVVENQAPAPAAPLGLPLGALGGGGSNADLAYSIEEGDR